MNQFESRTDLPVILIVDDEKTLRLVMRRTLEREGYCVTEADDGQQCLNICQEQLPDIILLDAMMPVLDGFSCCTQLQNMFGDRCPPVLIITALNDQTSVDKAFSAGAADYITKPIHWAVLRQRVRRTLQTNWAMAELRHKIEQVHSLMQELETANQELQRLASLDSLTQIANRRAFDDYLEREWKRLTREQLSLTLILCDIDFFKVYNDTYGHQSGDECLRQVAQVIRYVLQRPADLAARYGGEEFAVILPNTSPEGGVEVAKRIRLKLKAVSMEPSSYIKIPVTLSFGIASIVPSKELSSEDLIAEADRSLYRAKVEGRDCIVCSQDEMPHPLSSSPSGVSRG